MQASDPATGWTDPTEQGKQSERPCRGAAKPTGHDRHAVPLEAGWYFPTAHCAQAMLPSKLTKVPGEQALHAIAPGTEVK